MTIDKGNVVIRNHEGIKDILHISTLEDRYWEATYVGGKGGSVTAMWILSV
jgi:hypothetical protein